MAGVGLTRVEIDGDKVPSDGEVLVPLPHSDMEDDALKISDNIVLITCYSVYATLLRIPLTTFFISSTFFSNVGTDSFL